MVSDGVYELCLPILEDPALEEEDKTDRLEELLSKETALTASSRENAVLAVLWRFRDALDPKPAASPPPMRHTVLRRPSPAPWQIPRASPPLSSPPAPGRSPAPPPGFGVAPPAFTRAKSSTASPFASPRPSPRPAFSSPQIPHSPNLNAYEFPTETTPGPEVQEGYASDNVDWLVNDDTASLASSLGGTPGNESGLNGAAAAFIQPQQVDMSPYDMLRSVMGEARSDEDIERALESNGYDLSATILNLMGEQSISSRHESSMVTDEDGTILVGKSMTPEPQRPVTPANQQRSLVVCKFWLSTGSCLRADCRFSHDLSNHVCKYWIMGNCLAGETCIFSHDPSNLINRLAVEENSMLDNSPPFMQAHHNFQIQDYNSFPSLQSIPPDQWPSPYQAQARSLAYGGPYGVGGYSAPPPFMAQQAFAGETSSQRSHSRPGSRQNSREPTPSVPSVDDTEAFPTLGSVSTKGGKKHHGKRGGHGHREHKEPVANSLADLVRMSPSPGPAQLRKPGKSGKGAANSRENSAAAQAIRSPQHIPWLETGDRSNKAYLRARQDAIKHGGLRNKFLQSAAQAWNRNDARAAKALSLRGQSENDLMRKAHREAARQLYEERNKDSSIGGELYVDLHGLHPEEAVEYLERVLLEQQTGARPIYAITGTGHHSKNGKDKVGKAIRAFLNDWNYAFREFSVPGDRNNVGGILGIDPSSYDKSAGMGAPSSSSAAAARADPGVSEGDGSVSGGSNAQHDTGSPVAPPRAGAGAGAVHDAPLPRASLK